MAYVLNSTAAGEQYGFERAIANFAIKAVHESVGLVNTTTVVTPTQGNVFEIPLFAPLAYQDYNPNGSGGNVSGDASEQTPPLGQSSITATPAVAATAFDIFYNATTSFNLAATLGSELGEAFGEKVDQRVAAAFLGFKATAGNTMYDVSADGFARVKELGALGLVDAGTSVSDASADANTVLGLIRLVKMQWKKARLPGSPVVVLDSDSQFRLLGELTGGAVTNNVSDMGNELLTTGSIQNIYGVSVTFSTFLQTATRTVNGQSVTATVGAYFGDQAVYTVMKQGLDIKMGEKPGGLQMWLTGVAYNGAGVGDLRRGGAINVA